MKTIAIIDDDPDISDLLQEVLTQAGYATMRAYSGTEAVMLLSQRKPDLVLLDRMLPGLSGDAVLPKLRGIPVIILSAVADVPGKVELLLAGAADYITKPFDSRELLARIAVQLRQPQFPVQKLVWQNLELEPNAHRVWADGREVRLTRTEYAILKLLMENPAQVITKSQILDHISRDTPDCTESSLKQHVSNLRRKLRDTAGADCIEAVWGIGFKLTQS